MLIKYFLGKTNIQCYTIDYMVIMLISFNGTFLFFVRLFDPLMRSFIINLLLFNREFISKYKENLLKEKNLRESFITNESMTTNERLSEYHLKIINFPPNFNKKEMKKLPSSPFLIAKSENNLSKNEPKPIKKKFSSTIFVKKLSFGGNIEMNSLNNSNKNNYSNLNINEDYYYNDRNLENNDIRNSISLIKSRMESIKSIESEISEEKEKDKDNNINVNINNIEPQKNEKDKDEEKANNTNITKSNLNSISHSLTNSFGSINRNYSNTSKAVKKRNRYNSITTSNLINQNLINRSNRFELRNKTSLFIRNLRKNNKSISNLRINNRNNKLLTPLSYKKKRSISRNNDDFYHEEISSFALMNYHLEINENLLRMIAISISINECRIYDDIKEYKNYYESTIPWDNKDFYKETTLFKEYNDDNIPNWIGIKNDSRFTNIQFKVMGYCPFVFHHIRLIDKISIDDLLLSLDPINNIKTIKEMKVSGGRGNNSIISTWDKKIIIKTINDNEREILTEKMLVNYHCLMKESNSILSRIYGIFKIELRDKGSIHVIVQRNMEDLPLETKVLTFDFKGSTVDRQTIDKRDINLDKEKLMSKYKNKVLKDIDLGIIGMEFILDFENWQKIMTIIDSDSSFLENFEVTDYSLVIFIHKYRKEDIIKNKGCPRIMPSKDNKYIFNFSIVDFLGPFNLEKKGEKLAKSLVGYIKKLKDTNFSVLDPYGYGKRFRSFCKRIIIDG